MSGGRTDLRNRERLTQEQKENGDEDEVGGKREMEEQSGAKRRKRERKKNMWKVNKRVGRREEIVEKRKGK